MVSGKEFIGAVVDMFGIHVDIIKTNGEMSYLFTKCAGNDSVIADATSCRIDPQVRSALVAYVKTKTAYSNWMKVKQKEEQVFRETLNEDVETLKRIYDEKCGFDDPTLFIQKVRESLEKRYLWNPEDSWQRPSSKYDDIDCYLHNGSLHITLRNDVEKYARPERYSFIGREYDQTLYIEDGKKAEQFAKNAISIPRAWHDVGKVSYGCSLGDKNWLQVACRVVLPVKISEDGYNALFSKYGL